MNEETRKLRFPAVIKLIEAVQRNIEGREQAEKYMDAQLPGEDYNREIIEVYSDDSCTVYQDVGCSEVFFINHTGGWSSTDNIKESYPEVYDVLKRKEIVD